MSGPLHAVLVENNSYDRAVIDAALESDPNIVLHYTVPDGLGPVDLAPTAWEGCLGDAKPHVVLLDLALGPRCEEELPKTDFQQRIREDGATLRALIEQLEEELDDMAPVVRISHLLSESLAVAERGKKAAHILRIVQMDCSDEVRSRIEPLLEAARAQEFVPDQLIDAVLTRLWRGKRSVADLAKHISRAPSLWRLLICIANNPDVCFFVVSHYATPAIGDSLKELLSARIQPPHPDFYSPFIINKSNLLNLSRRVREAYSSWYVLASLSPVVEPFASYPVCAGKKVTTFGKWIEKQSLDHLSENAPVQQLILWDESGTFEGGIERWKSIQKRWRNGLEVVQRSAPSIKPTFKSALVVEPKALETASDGAEWADSMSAVFAGRTKAKRETLVVVRGTHTAYAASSNRLPGVVWYRIPSFHDKSFSEHLSTVDLVRRLVVTSHGDDFHLQQWSDVPDGSIARPLSDVLLGLCPKAEEANDRLAYHLQQVSKTKLNALQALASIAAPALKDLRLTLGDEQDWEQVFDNAGLTTAPWYW